MLYLRLSQCIHHCHDQLGQELLPFLAHYIRSNLRLLQNLVLVLGKQHRF